MNGEEWKEGRKEGRMDGRKERKQLLLSVTALAYDNLNSMQNCSLLKILIVYEYLIIFILLQRCEFFLCKFYTTNKFQHVL